MFVKTRSIPVSRGLRNESGVKFGAPDDDKEGRASTDCTRVAQVNGITRVAHLSPLRASSPCGEQGGKGSPPHTRFRSASRRIGRGNRRWMRRRASLRLLRSRFLPGVYGRCRNTRAIRSSSSLESCHCAGLRARLRQPPPRSRFFNNPGAPSPSYLVVAPDVEQLSCSRGPLASLRSARASLLFQPTSLAASRASVVPRSVDEVGLVPHPTARAQRNSPLDLPSAGRWNCARCARLFIASQPPVLLHLLSPASLVGCTCRRNFVFEVLQCPLAGGRAISKSNVQPASAWPSWFISVSHAVSCVSNEGIASLARR
jgi:hypothetical protein